MPHLSGMTDKNLQVDILVGPTASGKTALAIAAAGKRPTVILNGDAMQMYAPLSVITARPTIEEMQAAEHRMYGIWPGEFEGNAQAWLDVIVQEIRAAWAAGKRPLVVGGTGMYLKALMEGFSPVPPVKPEIREALRVYEEQRSYEGRKVVAAALYSMLEKEDPAMAVKLKPGDTQRIMRALEVIRSTGKSLALWQVEGAVKPVDARFNVYALMPEREALYDKINRRFILMMDEGALDEARAVRDLPRHLPMLQSHGMPELLAYLDGTMGLEEAVQRAQQHTRNYAKRQVTWIRNQCKDALPGTALLG